MTFRDFLVYDIGRLIPDKPWIQLKYLQHFGRFCNFKKPETFNEILQWLKLYDRNPLYTTLVDKFAVRRYIEEKIGEEYLIPLVGGPWKSFEEINFDALPDQFVLKCTHDCGSILICKDKNRFDFDAAHKKMNKSLKLNYYYNGREWPYKNVPPQIIAEKFMRDGNNDHLPVYKFFCFNGEPRIIQTVQNDKQPDESIDYFDTSWNLLKLKQNFPNSKAPLSRPKPLPEMLEIATTLSNGFSFIRVDLYVINSKVMFSEFTFYSDSGFVPFDPPEWDYKLGEWIKLPGRRNKK